MTPTFIQAVPWIPERAVRARRLREETGGTVVWDENQNPFDTYKAVMRAMGAGPGIVIEDDVILCADWRERVEALIAEHPEDVLKFYGNDPAEPGFVRHPGKHFGVAVCVYYPAGIAAEFLAYVGEAETAFHVQYHDLLFGRFLARTKRDFWEFSPHLVQHEPWTSTVLPGRSRKRHSPSFESGAS